MRAINVQVRDGNADNPNEGVTIAVDLSNGDTIQIEVVPENDSIWVQYNTLEGTSLVPGDGHQMDLSGNPVMI